ncbi:hypothetical protein CHINAEXTREME_17215 [Halobiforma lacisalsi AJ5]|uniref:Uncharacterized protein n=1 Tax=Natronobacterium lacisalsi AJ5 TaxID=358396 RepID=M0LP72_NATLA|nr:hypothetical protein [Halobiforma lacisalsi]APW99402.1 hypothetical protein CHINAEXTREME_17215 [Halobiforma lacisalsi AJ5]EMA35296.1 hypothetical protein C445_05568 [Halobiforma lacisalsi AJ5]
MAVQPYTISHTGQVLGDEQVDVEQNSEGRQSAILSFTCPRNFERIHYIGNRDPTRFVPRTMETGQGPDVDLDAAIQPVAGEEDLDDQPYPAVQAVDVSGADPVEVDVLDVDYATGTVTLDVADGTDVKVFPIITEGNLKFRGLDTLGHNKGPINEWPFPIQRFHDFEQDKRGTEINMHGSVTWKRHETVEVMLESPRALVWEDGDYTDAGLGSYVSTFEQDVEIEH